MLQGLIFFVYSVSAAQMNWGFYPPTSAEIPNSVQSARSKIFHITMPFYITLSEKEYSVILAAQGMPEETKTATLECQHQKRPKCVVPFSQINGTAFLDKSPDHVWTNCHIVVEWMQFVGQQQTFQKSDQVRAFFSKQKMPLQLQSTDGQLVYDSSEEAYLKVFSAQPNFPIVESGCNRRDDLVKIKLSRPLSDTGLEWQKGKYQGPIFMGGFPRPTESRKEIGKQDSDGKNFFWTFGDGFNKESPEAQDYLQQKPNLEIALAGPYLQVHYADGVEGMSGSPVLTGDGKVLGIYQGFLPLSDEQRDIPFISLYTTVEGMRYVEILSGE